MDINPGNINALNTRINVAFNKRLEVVQPTWSRFSMEIPSSAGANFYPRLADLPALREWKGSRVVHRLSVADRMVITNRKFEGTLSITKEDLEDDQFAFLMPQVDELGQQGGELPDKLVYEKLAEGRTATGIGMDGQMFFDTDHPGYDNTGKLVSWSNLLTIKAGETAQPWWYVFDTSRSLKPMVYQPRRPFAIVAKTRLTDDNVFWDDEFVWGTDGRCAAGFGWHMYAVCTNRPPTAAAFQDIISALASQCRRDGQPYGVKPTLVVCPKSLEGAIRMLLKSTLVPVLAPDNATWVTGNNVWADYCDVLAADRLPQAVGA